MFGTSSLVIALMEQKRVENCIILDEYVEDRQYECNAINLQPCAGEFFFIKLVVNLKGDNVFWVL